MFEEIQARRLAVAQNIEKSLSNAFEDNDAIEKAHYEGDLLFLNGKNYIYTQYKPGHFDWRVMKAPSVIQGKGINGVHGIKAIKSAFSSLSKDFTNPDRMLLKRTPNGHWRLMYDGQDTGMSIPGDTFTESELKADNVCYQTRRVVDNFEMLKNYMEFNSPDDVYFVQIIKRWKDNKDLPEADAWKARGKAQGSYNSGGEYLNYWLIHSPSELDAIKADILKICSYNNARAYISINSRSQNQVNQYLPKFQAKWSDPNDPRRKNAEAILYGMAKTGPAWKNERFKVLLDIDTTKESEVTIGGKKVNVWDETRKRLNSYGIKVAAEYETPSGGLHLILNNKNNRNLVPFYRGVKDFDGGRDLGKTATVHPSEDIKMVLYSNVDTGGY